MVSRLPVVDQSFATRSQVAQPVEVEKYLAAETAKALGATSLLAFHSLRLLLAAPLRRLARLALQFDHWVAEAGLPAAAARLLPRFVPQLSVLGAENIPLQGPALIASNHPGTFDGLAILANLPRQDVAVVLAGNPFFRAFRQARRFFIYSTLDPYARMAVVRAAARHLQQGGALLIFATGKLDPDPAYFYPLARDAIERWSPSIPYLLQKAPETRLVPVAAGGFVARACINSPLAQLRRNPADRQRLAEFIQVIEQIALGVRFRLAPKLLFGPPALIQPGSLSDSQIAAQQVRSAAQSALQAAFGANG